MMNVNLILLLLIFLTVLSVNSGSSVISKTENVVQAASNTYEYRLTFEPVTGAGCATDGSQYAASCRFPGNECGPMNVTCFDFPSEN